MAFLYKTVSPPRPILLFLPDKNPRKTPTFFPKSMSWTCSKCTFTNPPGQKSTCQICLSTPPPSSSSPSSSLSPPKPKWSCKSCTFLNSYHSTFCEICGTRALASFSTSLEDDELDSSVGNVFLPLQRCKRKSRENPIEIVDDFDDAGGSKSANKAVSSVTESELQKCNLGNFDDTGGFRGSKAANKAVSPVTDSALGLKVSKLQTAHHLRQTECVPDETQSGTDLRTLKILSYNVWFREELEMHKRMKAIGDLIQLHSPDLICLQEVTPNIYDIFQQSSWWKLYHCTIANEMALMRPYFCMQLSKFPVKSFSCKPFSNTMMGRELCVAEVAVQLGMPLVIATSHLESPCPGPPTWDQMYSRERVDQAKEALNFLKENPNVIFCGDMNWDDKLDGQFPLPDGWIDAWTQLRPEENGWTYDTKSNPMLSGNRKLQKRLDRFLCGLHDFKINGIDMIGMEAIQGLSYCKEKKVKKEVKNLMLPVLPSDHFGLLLTICAKKH